jgi:ribonuclease D
MTGAPGPAPTPLLITEPAGLQQVMRRLRTGRRVALDTEAASFHRYVDRVYLVQVSSDDETALIDPLAVADLGPVGALLADPELEVVFHDADYDLRILDRDYGFRARRLWDTKVAAQLAGETAFGLSALLEKFFGLRLSKKLQRADWSRRPLTDEMVAYAAADTAYLPALRDLLADRLRARGRVHWAEEEFVRLEAVRWTGRGTAGEEFLQMKGAKALRGQALAVFQKLWEWRERTAEELDRAPFRVLANDLLLTLARLAPESASALASIRGMPPTIARRNGDGILEAVAAGRAVPERDWPRVERQRRPPPDPDTDARYQRLRALRAERAPAVGLDPGLLCPNGVLLAVARAAPRDRGQLAAVSDLRRWQREALGDDGLLQATR